MARGRTRGLTVVALSGTFVAVVGPSGAGKDTLMRIARETLRREARVHFVRRAITRPADPSEDHDPVTPQEFDERLASGRIGLHWQAHGLRYGLPAEVLRRIGDGDTVVANVSRTVVPEIAMRYPRHLVVEVVADETVRFARIAGRSRASDRLSGDRLARKTVFARTPSTVTIQNDGPAEEGGALLASHIMQSLAR